jgi:hypothetical protein
VFVHMQGDRIHCLTRLCYFKSNNCFELCEGMEVIKAHFLLMSETYLTTNSLLCEKSEYLLTHLSQMNRSPQLRTVNS